MAQAGVGGRCLHLSSRWLHDVSFHRNPEVLIADIVCSEGLEDVLEFCALHRGHANVGVIQRNCLTGGAEIGPRRHVEGGERGRGSPLWVIRDGREAPIFDDKRNSPVGFASLYIRRRGNPFSVPADFGDVITEE